MIVDTATLLIVSYIYMLYHLLPIMGSLIISPEKDLILRIGFDLLI